MAVEIMTHTHSVVDDDRHFLIDPDTKKITAQHQNLVLAQRSKNSEVLTFEIPSQTVEGHDMTKCNLVAIHYQNIEQGSQRKNIGIYKVKELNTAAGDVVTLSWLIDDNVTMYAGGLLFSIHFSCTDADGKVVYNFPTLTYSELTVGATTWNSETIANEFPDIIADHEARISAMEQGGTGGGSGGNVDYVGVEPAEDDIPKVFITGVKPTTKDDVLAEMQYVSKTDKFHAYLEIKCQGSSSMNYAKKNFTVKLYNDEARETKQKKVFKDWKHESNKFVLKANWIDHSHARNIVSARIWDEVVKSRSDYYTLPEEMRNSPQSGAIDGFPVKLYYNGTYEGLYTWNIGKDAWMWGMDEDNPNHALLSCCYNDNGVLSEKAGNFRALWSGTDKDNWAIEVGSASTTLTNSLNALISCVKDTDDETFKSTIGNYLDINSAIDYYLYFWANAGLDSLENNMLLATYDGVKWICGAYDMDSVWGLHYTGGSFISTTFKCPDQYQGPYSLLWERITKLFMPELQARYAELRSGVLSYPNIVTHFEWFMDVIGSELYAEDLIVYAGIPSGTSNNIKQIRNYVRDRLSYVDDEISQLKPPVYCTGINLSANRLDFTAEGLQTLTATVYPADCTEMVVWTTDNYNVASVDNGVVTALDNGTAVITATCGKYSASCIVSVSGITVQDVDPIIWLNGADFTNDIIGENGTGSFLDAAGGRTINFSGFEKTGISGADGTGAIAVSKKERFQIYDMNNPISHSAFTFVYKGVLTPDQGSSYLMQMVAGISVIYGYVTNTVELYEASQTVVLRSGSQILVNDGNEHTIAYAYDGTSLRCYLDGNKIATTEKSYMEYNNITNTYFACSQSGDSMSGKIRHMMFYNVALTDKQIARVINNI